MRIAAQAKVGSAFYQLRNLRQDGEANQELVSFMSSVRRVWEEKKLILPIRFYVWGSLISRSTKARRVGTKRYVKRWSRTLICDQLVCFCDSTRQEELTLKILSALSGWLSYKSRINASMPKLDPPVCACAPIEVIEVHSCRVVCCSVCLPFLCCAVLYWYFLCYPQWSLLLSSILWETHFGFLVRWTDE